MKKITTFVWSILCMTMAFTSCTNDTDVEEVKVPVVDAPQEITMHRSLSEAIQIAKNAPAMIGGQSRSANTNRAIDMSSIACLTAGGPKSRAVENDDTLLYILNYADGNGFAIVSASNATTGLLGITESGRYGTSEVEENNGIQMFINSAKRYVQNAVADSITRMAMAASGPQVQVRLISDTVYTAAVAPRVQVKWDQYWPCNLYSINPGDVKVAGCGPLAAAMAMSYFERTTSMNLTFDGTLFYVLPLPWAALKQHVKREYIEYPACPQYTHEFIGLLCRQIAEETGAVFKEGKTSTTIGNVRDFFGSNGYFVSDVEDYYTDAVKENIGSGIIFMKGDNEDGEGHAWLADGVLSFTISNFLFASTDYGVSWSLLGHQTDSYTFNHYNWGANLGVCNGYFLSNVFDLDQGVYDSGSTPNGSADTIFDDDVEYFSIW